MGHGGDNTAEPSLLANGSRKRPHRRRQQITKKRKILSSETNTHIRFQSPKHDSSSNTRSKTNSHNFTIEEKPDKKSRRAFNRRKWTYSTHDFPNYTDKVVLVSYNILGVENATKHPDLYRGVLPKYLDWEYRKKLLCKEVMGYNPSVLCFQEVDRFGDLSELLGKDGFKGVHKARSGEACDGCAIFWNPKLFTLLHEESIEFQRFGLRHNVAQFCVLKMNQNPTHRVDTKQSVSNKTSRSLLVGNIHILFNPNRGDIKLGQVRMFLEKAYELSQEWGCIPVVLAGDMNSLPQSAMYQFLASSELHVQRHDRRQISGQICSSHQYAEFRSRFNHISRPIMHRWAGEEIMLATGSRSNCMRHHLKLSSAYAEIPARGSSKTRDQVGEPLATSYHCMFSGTVDYIWHTLDLVPLKVLETLPMRKLMKTGGLPSKKWGSDHLALVCELAFADDAD